MTRRVAFAALAILAACGQDAADDLRDDPVAEGEAAAVQNDDGPDDLLPPLEGEDVWIVDPDASSVMFTGRQGDEDFTGRFGAFDAQIRFDSDDLDNAVINAAVDLGSVDAGSNDRNASLPERGWFDTARFPRATFRSSAVRAVGGDGYEADGTLTIKGVDRPVTMPFTLAVMGERAVADGQLALDRTVFGIGQGDFAGPEWVATEVSVAVHIEATRAD